MPSIITHAACGGEPCAWGHAMSIKAKACLQGPCMTLPWASRVNADAFCWFAALMKFGAPNCMHQPHMLHSVNQSCSALASAVASCDTALPAMTPDAAAQGRTETRYAADFADPFALPPPTSPAGMTPGATTCDLAAGTVRGGRHIPGAAAPCQPL